MKKRIRYWINRFLEAIHRRPINAIIKVVQPSEVLTDKVALITGGTSGIGKAIATCFIKAGAFVVITSRSADKAMKIAKEIDPTGNKAIGLAHDNTDINGLSDFIDSVESKVPGNKIDILVNNAGLVGGDIRNTTGEEFDRIVATNLKGVFFLSKIVAKHMIKGQIEGHILNIASSSSLRPATSAYTLTKWGIRGMTMGLAKMLAPHKITVNGLAPGPTATPMLGKMDYSDISLPTNPIGRYALPEEIAAMALFLCGEQGATIVGDIIFMTGGAGVIEFNDIDYTFELD